MKQVNVKKLILPNIPYVFIALLATKVSEAVRLAPGSDASAKLLNIMTGLNTAFHSLVPSFHPIDLCVGVAAAIAIRLAVYIKGKNAKKFRKNLEYGSARWGTAEDIKPYVDPAFENNIILTQTERLTMNSRPKDPKTARNKNVLIVGGSGSGKTRFWLKPNLLQCTSKTYPTSFVVTDPKGDIVVSCGHALQKNGYQIKILNSLNFKKSMHYNPFAYIHSEKDILKLVTTLIANTKGERYLDTYESTHDYDEYHFDLDTIEHDPYVLISMITALHQGEWTLDEVQGTLQMLFDRQYILTEDVVVETRYRTETDTWTDADGNTHTDTYQVPYDYYICTVTLENFNLSHVPVYIMSEEQLGMYATYMATLGNRPDLFPGSGYIGKYVEGSYTDYDIPPEALDDEVFAAIIKEAEKYLGYPYVWGGSSPSTSFDCSGFVSWVINHSGWDVGRLGAQGLCNICTPVSSANVKPGDLVFFTGTYDTPGVSHVGIYVGNNMMIHCGDPISYANLNSNYWQSHFYRYGRLP